LAEHYDRGRHACSIRPCGVYGIDPDLPRSRGYDLLRKLAAGEPIRQPGGASGSTSTTRSPPSPAPSATPPRRSPVQSRGTAICGTPIGRRSGPRSWASKATSTSPALPSRRTRSQGRGRQRLGVKLDRGSRGHPGAPACTGCGDAPARRAQAMSGQYDVIVLGVGTMGSAACEVLARRGSSRPGAGPVRYPPLSGRHHGQSRMFRTQYYEHPDYSLSCSARSPAGATWKPRKS
jgi:hypothetical protein